MNLQSSTRDNASAIDLLIALQSEDGYLWAVNRSGDMDAFEIERKELECDAEYTYKAISADTCMQGGGVFEYHEFTIDGWTFTVQDHKKLN
jgi:hypothetical protein